MSTKDDANVTYAFDMEFLGSPAGRRFLEMKYSGRIERLKKYFGERLTGIRLLDVGIGYGMFLKALEEIGVRDLHGMDPFERSIEIAGGNTSASLARGDITDDRWPFEKGSFDAITCLDVVEHLERPGVFFERVGEYLRPGGIVIVTTPNKGLPYMLRSVPLIGIPDGNPTHINVRRPSYWKRLAAEHHFEILDSWKGEYLTHVRVMPKILAAACRLLRLDHRRIPLVDSFEQSFGMVLRRRGAAAEDDPRR